MVDLKEISLEDLVKQFSELMTAQPIQEIKEQANAIKSSFYAQYNALIAEKKETFIEEGGDELAFDFQHPIQEEFKLLWKKYTKAKTDYHEQLSKQLQENLVKKEAIIENIKALIDENQPGADYNKFKALIEEWKAIGQVPSDKYQQLWGNYHHYIEQYYDLLHLSNDLRDLDFKHNFEAKQQIIAKAQELLEHHDVNFAFNELQVLHRIWKEETGPVAKEHREVVWQKFSDVTSDIHKKRETFLQELKDKEEENYQLKLVKIQEIINFNYSKNQSFGDWKKSIERFEKLKEEFLRIGKVPKSKNKEIWEDFKAATKGFNQAKNIFFKEAKQAQYGSLQQKKELIRIAKEHKDSNDFETALGIYKKIQLDWKKTGHVSRKQADALWHEFQTVCNEFFDRYHIIKKEGTPEEQENYTKREAFLKEIATLTVTDENLEEVLESWLNTGEIPIQKNKIDQDIRSAITKSYEAGTVKEFSQFKIKAYYLLAIGGRKLSHELDNYRKKIDTITRDVKQLENNLGFVSSSSGKGGKENPLLAAVHKSIEENNQKIQNLQKEYKYLKKLL